MKPQFLTLSDFEKTKQHVRTLDISTSNYRNFSARKIKAFQQQQGVNFGKLQNFQFIKEKDHKNDNKLLIQNDNHHKLLIKKFDY